MWKENVHPKLTKSIFVCREVIVTVNGQIIISSLLSILSRKEMRPLALCLLFKKGL